MLPEDFPFSQIIKTLPMIKTLELFPYNNTINATHTNNIIIFVQHHLEQGKRDTVRYLHFIREIPRLKTLI